MAYLIVFGAAAYLSLVILAVYLYLVAAGYKVEVRELREQNERYANALSQQYPTPPIPSGLIRPSPPEDLTPGSTYFKRRKIKGW